MGCTGKFSHEKISRAGLFILVVVTAIRLSQTNDPVYACLPGVSYLEYRGGGVVYGKECFLDSILLA